MNRVALVQMVSSAKIADNLQLIEQYVIQAREQEASLVVLPENFAFMGMNEREKLHIAEHYGQGLYKKKSVS